ncbi:hypothetical protein CCMA1212_006576 [Trichoderma ghanense]|uniref:Uncharacterized protein n=1 Tax=Trichoderma ghanense TaxID=65468 RepID=A0ABY2H1N0_9HYPO
MIHPDAQVSLSGNWLLVGPINPLPSLAPGQSKPRPPFSPLICHVRASGSGSQTNAILYHELHAISPRQLLPQSTRDKASRSCVAAIRIPPRTNGHRHTFVQILDRVMLGSVASLKVVARCGRFVQQPPRASRPAKEAFLAGSAGGAAFRPLVGQPSCQRRGGSHSPGVHELTSR